MDHGKGEKMRLQDFNVEELRRMKLDIKALEDWYKGGKKLRRGSLSSSKYAYECPLCNFDESIKGGDYGCNCCPWHVIEDMGCAEFVGEKEFVEDIEDLRNARNPEWVKLRLRMIKDWLAKTTPPANIAP